MGVNRLACVGRPRSFGLRIFDLLTSRPCLPKLSTRTPKTKVTVPHAAVILKPILGSLCETEPQNNPDSEPPPYSTQEALDSPCVLADDDAISLGLGGLPSRSRGSPVCLHCLLGLRGFWSYLKSKPLHAQALNRSKNSQAICTLRVRRYRLGRLRSGFYVCPCLRLAARELL